MAKKNLDKDYFEDMIENVNLKKIGEEIKEKNYYQMDKTEDIVYVSLPERIKMSVNSDNVDLTDGTKGFITRAIDYYVMMHSAENSTEAEATLKNAIADNERITNDLNNLAKTIPAEADKSGNVNTTLLNDEMDIVYTFLLTDSK